MRKTVIASERMGERYLRLEHESGLAILLYPMKGFQTAEICSCPIQILLDFYRMTLIFSCM